MAIKTLLEQHRWWGPKTLASPRGGHLLRGEDLLLTHVGKHRLRWRGAGGGQHRLGQGRGGLLGPGGLHLHGLLLGISCCKESKEPVIPSHKERAHTRTHTQTLTPQV